MLVKKGRIKVPSLEGYDYIVDIYKVLQHDTNQNGIIPWKTIVDFAKIYSIENFELLVHCIRVIEKVLKEKNDKS